MAYLLSCPGRSLTNDIKSLYGFWDGFKLSKIEHIDSTVCRFVLTELPPIQYVNPVLDEFIDFKIASI